MQSRLLPQFLYFLFSWNRTVPKLTPVHLLNSRRHNFPLLFLSFPCAAYCYPNLPALPKWPLGKDMFPGQHLQQFLHFALKFDNGLTGTRVLLWNKRKQGEK